jgi:hypothetical protein
MCALRIVRLLPGFTANARKFRAFAARSKRAPLASMTIVDSIAGVAVGPAAFSRS